MQWHVSCEYHGTSVASRQAQHSWKARSMLSAAVVLILERTM